MYRTHLKQSVTQHKVNTKSGISIFHSPLHECPSNRVDLTVVENSNENKTSGNAVAKEENV